MKSGGSPDSAKKPNCSRIGCAQSVAPRHADDVHQIVSDATACFKLSPMPPIISNGLRCHRFIYTNNNPFSAKHARTVWHAHIVKGISRNVSRAMSYKRTVSSTIKSRHPLKKSMTSARSERRI